MFVLGEKAVDDKPLTESCDAFHVVDMIKSEVEKMRRKKKNSKTRKNFTSQILAPQCSNIPLVSLPELG